MGDLVVCRYCHRRYDPKSSSSHTSEYCNSCCVNKRRFIRKKRMVEYAGGKCVVCGYSKCINALCFHHRDPSTKELNISGGHCVSWERLVAEIGKCDLLCANCHMEKHWEIDSVSYRYEDHVFREVKDRTSVCLTCGTLFLGKGKVNKYCSAACYGLACRKVAWPDKGTLEEDISSMSWVAVGRKYGVSDNAVRKWARDYGLLDKKQTGSSMVEQQTYNLPAPD